MGNGHQYMEDEEGKKKYLTIQKDLCCFIPSKECEGLSYCGECIGESEEENDEKCDICVNWAKQCWFNDDFRRGCQNYQHIFYVEKLVNIK